MKLIPPIKIDYHSESYHLASAILFCIAIIGAIAAVFGFTEEEDTPVVIGVSLLVSASILSFFFRGIRRILENQEILADKLNEIIETNKISNAETENQKTENSQTDTTNNNSKTITEVTVNNSSGLNYYSSLSSDVTGEIPHGEKIQIICENVGIKEIDNTKYIMAKGIYNDEIIYIAYKKYNQ